MTRYIDADAYLKKICTYNETGCGSCRFQTKCPADEPAIEAEPVRHGKWIKADSQQYFRKHYPAFTCSECGQRKDSQKKWNYCPNCGARMDEMNYCGRAVRVND